MTLAHRDGNLIHVPAQPAKVRDVSGAGDTVVAVLAVTLAAKAELGRCVALADAAAGVAVGKPGTATVSRGRAARKILPARRRSRRRRRSSATVAARCAGGRMARAGARVGFTNGCFDILHPGHVRF